MYCVYNLFENMIVIRKYMKFNISIFLFIF